MPCTFSLSFNVKKSFGHIWDFLKLHKIWADLNFYFFHFIGGTKGKNQKLVNPLFCVSPYFLLHIPFLNFMHGFKKAILAIFQFWQNGTVRNPAWNSIFLPKYFFWSIMKMAFTKKASHRVCQIQAKVSQSRKMRFSQKGLPSLESKIIEKKKQCG